MTFLDYLDVERKYGHLLWPTHVLVIAMILTFFAGVILGGRP